MTPRDTPAPVAEGQALRCRDCDHTFAPAPSVGGWPMCPSCWSRSTQEHPSEDHGPRSTYSQPPRQATGYRVRLPSGSYAGEVKDTPEEAACEAERMWCGKDWAVWGVVVERTP